jgi:hypothetical protein
VTTAPPPSTSSDEWQRWARPDQTASIVVTVWPTSLPTAHWAIFDAPASASPDQRCTSSIRDPARCIATLPDGRFLEVATDGLPTGQVHEILDDALSARR